MCDLVISNNLLQETVRCQFFGPPHPSKWRILNVMGLVSDPTPQLCKLGPLSMQMFFPDVISQYLPVKIFLETPKLHLKNLHNDLESLNYLE